MSVESGEYSEDSLPRQSVFRRTANVFPKINADSERLENESKHELSESRNVSGHSGNENGALSLRVSIPKMYSSGKSPKRYSNDSDSDTMTTSTNQTSLVNETRLVCHSTDSFYKQGKTSGQCFYKDENSDNENGYSKRKASKKVKYSAFSESEGEEEEEEKVGVTAHRSRRKNVQSRYDNDSDFVVS